MWTETKLESYLEKRIKDELSIDEATGLLARYKTAKDYLDKDIYDYIARVECELTDHSAHHIANVLNNAWHLISGECCMNPVELYVLCSSILFHDTGNIEGRKDHQNKVDEIYNLCFGGNAVTTERRLTLGVVRAHCGTSKKGDRDTLLDVPEVLFYLNAPVRLREIASVVRLADELAEGPQRTSKYMISHDKFSDKSIIYHKYAKSTEVYIDKGNNRIILVYNIELSDFHDISELKNFLEYIYSRIIKLDYERRYCKYYATCLDKFKKTEVSFNFSNNGIDCDIPLSIELVDKYPFIEDDSSALQNMFPELNVDAIISKLPIDYESFRV